MATWIRVVRYATTDDLVLGRKRISESFFHHHDDHKTYSTMIFDTNGRQISIADPRLLGREGPADWDYDALEIKCAKCQAIVRTIEIDDTLFLLREQAPPFTVQMDWFGDSAILPNPKP